MDHQLKKNAMLSRHLYRFRDLFYSGTQKKFIYLFSLCHQAGGRTITTNSVTGHHILTTPSGQIVVSQSPQVLMAQQQPTQV